MRNVEHFAHIFCVWPLRTLMKYCRSAQNYSAESKKQTEMCNKDSVITVIFVAGQSKQVKYDAIILGGVQSAPARWNG